MLGERTSSSRILEYQQHEKKHSLDRRLVDQLLLDTNPRLLELQEPRKVNQIVLELFLGQKELYHLGAVGHKHPRRRKATGETRVYGLLLVWRMPS